MDALTLKINLDCLRKDSQAIINAKVGEANGRKVVFTLYEGRTAFFVPDGASVIFRAQKPDGTILYNNCVIDDGKVEYTITSQTVAVAGVYACELQIVSDGRIIYSPYVTLNVMDNLYADTEVESSNEFTELENALNKIPPLEVIYSKYTKPESGIPKSDLAQDVQNSLNKAETALQEHQSLDAYRTASEQDIIDNTKQDKLTAGDNITIAADGTISSTGGGAKAFFLNVFVITETEVVTNKTYAEIKAAIDAGDIIYITDKNGIVYVPQVGTTNTKIELLWIESQGNRTLYWTAVVDSENAWSAAEFELVDIDKLVFELSDKVDKVTGKGLSSNDYTAADKAKVDALKPVATSGSYNDLTDKPTIPDAVTEATVSGWGFTKNTGTYSKPTDGIPKMDLSSSVQASLNKADSALQSHQSLAAYRTALAQDVIDSDLGDRIEVIEGKEAGWDAKSDFSGSYNDLTDKPTIPTEVTPLIGATNNLTPTQVYNAVSAGVPVKVQYTDDTYGLLSFMAFNIAESLSMIVSQSIVYYGGIYILTELFGNKSNNRWGFNATTLAQKTDIPDVPPALPNPNALIIKIGSTTVTYDGSTAQTVTIDDGTEVSY